MQERRWLGILYGPILCLGILLGPGLCSCILRAPHLCSGIFHSGILHVPDPSLLLHVPHLCPRILYDLGLGILYGLRLGILYRLYALDLRPCIFLLHRLYARYLWPCIFLGRPSLELIQQDVGWWLTDFSLTLIGSFKSGRIKSSSFFAACRRLTCSRRQSLSIGGRLN